MEEVKKGECILTGTYFFFNDASIGIKQNLYYPFVVKDFLPYPYGIEIKLLKNNSALPIIKTAKGIIFTLNIEPKDTSKVQVIYYQKTPSNKMEYILTTTKKWGKPFAEAEYTVKIPVNFKLTEMQPIYENEYYDQDYKFYSTIKKDYMPIGNFYIHWLEDKNE